MKKKGEGKNSDNSKREEILQKAGAYSAVFFMAFFVALVSASAFTPVDKSNATSDLNINYSNTGYSINIASFGTDAQTPGEVRMSLTGAPDTGSVAIEYDKLQVQTNSSGYKVYIGMKDSSQKLVNYTSTASGEYCEQAEATTGCYFNAVSGSTQTPVKLEMNTWGFAVPKDANAPSKVAGYGFDPAYITSSKKISDGMSNIKPTESSIDLNNKFAAVPAAGSEAMIAGGTNTSGQEATSNYYVFYGIKANTALAAGEYKGTVVYTALAEASPSTGEVSATPSYQKTLDGSGSGEGRITVETKIYGSSELVNKIMNDHSATVTIGGETCTNVSVIGPTIDEGSMGPISIACDTPTMKRYGTYDVVATVGDYGTYTKNNGYSYYIPWADMKNAEPGTYKMQEFTAKTCSEMTTPGSYTGDVTHTTGTGADAASAVVTSYDYHPVGAYVDTNGDMKTTDEAKNQYYDKDGNGNVRITNDDPLANSQVILTDVRDDKQYRIRKLADGNCWMTENLRLALDKTKPLTDNTSDINYNMDTGAKASKINGEATTVVRNVTNPLDTDPLGTYSTDGNGNVSWTPYANSQTVYAGRVEDKISWGTKYKGENCTDKVTTGGVTSALIFKPGMADSETESAEGHVANNKCSEYARSYSNELNNQSGTGTEPDKLKVEDGDGIAQYYGTYYNWYAATAGSGTYAQNVVWQMTENSVCPANWQLPTGRNDKSWHNLLTTTYGMTSAGNNKNDVNNPLFWPIYTENSMLKARPFSFAQSGYYSWVSGGLSSRGGYAIYWAGASNNSHDSISLTLDTLMSLYPQATNEVVHGLIIRCVAR